MEENSLNLDNEQYTKQYTNTKYRVINRLRKGTFYKAIREQKLRKEIALLCLAIFYKI